MTTLSLTSPASSLLPTTSLEPLLLRLHASASISQFWQALQPLLRHAVPYDALVVYLNFFDFASSWRAATILATPNAQRPTTWFEARRQVDMTPQFVLSHQKRIKLYRLSDVVADAGSLRRTAFFKDFLAPSGWHHLAVALFWRGSTVCSEIALRRTKDQGDFTDAEMKLLAKLHCHVEIVLNRLIQQEEERARHSWMEEFNDHLPFALLFLNFELQTIYANREALEQCAMWNFGPDRAQAFQPRDVFRVPDEIHRACADLKTQWLLRAATDPGRPETQLSIRHSHSRFPELTVNIRLHTEIPCAAAKPGLVIHLSRQTRTAEHGSSLPIHSMFGKLTDSEREVARLMVEGLSNGEIAGRLSKSIDTVKCQITSIYKKTGVPSRARLLALVRS